MEVDTRKDMVPTAPRVKDDDKSLIESSFQGDQEHNI